MKRSCDEKSKVDINEMVVDGTGDAFELLDLLTGTEKRAPGSILAFACMLSRIVA